MANNKGKYQPRKVKTKEITRFRGILDPDGKHNLPDAYVSGANNLQSTKIGRLETRGGQVFDAQFSGDVHTGANLLNFYVVCASTDILVDFLLGSPLDSITSYPPQGGGGTILFPPNVDPPTVPPLPPPLPPLPPLITTPPTGWPPDFVFVEMFISPESHTWFEVEGYV